MEDDILSVTKMDSEWFIIFDGPELFSHLIDPDEPDCQFYSVNFPQYLNPFMPIDMVIVKCDRRQGKGDGEGLHKQPEVHELSPILPGTPHK